MECVKFIMFGFTVVFWLYGAAILGVGISLAVDPGAFDVLGAVGRAGMNNYLWATTVYFFIVIGALAFLIGFSGCWIACISNSSCIPLWIYSVLVGAIISAEIVVVILTAIYWGSADDDVAKEMYNDVRTKYDDAILYDALYTSWNTMQMEWQCCGSYNYTDYKYSKYDENSEDPDVWIPESCCKDTTDSTNKDQCQKGNIQFIYNQGCYEALREFLDQNAAIIIGVACGFAALQILEIVFVSCFLIDEPETSHVKPRTQTNMHTNTNMRTNTYAMKFWLFAPKVHRLIKVIRSFHVNATMNK